MGSYGTGELSAAPRRRRSSPGSSGGGGRSSRNTTPPAPTEEPEPTPTTVSANYDPDLKTVVALGGGLTPDRIVQPIPEEIRDQNLSHVVKYLMGDEVASRPEDRTIVDAVQERMEAPDYRIIVNDALNLGNERMQTPLVQYLIQKTQQGEDGELKYNFADIAIVSHDEGGKPYSLEEKL